MSKSTTTMLMAAMSTAFPHYPTGRNGHLCYPRKDLQAHHFGRTPKAFGKSKKKNIGNHWLRRWSK